MQKLCSICRGQGVTHDGNCSYCKGTGTKRRRGRPSGIHTPTGTRSGTFGDWLSWAKPGDVWWSERDMRSLSGDAWKAGKRVACLRFIAVHPETLQARKLTRVEILASVVVL